MMRRKTSKPRDNIVPTFCIQNERISILIEQYEEDKHCNF